MSSPTGSALEDLNCASSLNTTECILVAAAKILGELQASNNETNWDPASFAMSSIIGIVALFFAILTIIQGLYAAGPGRVKCSPYAIGSWAGLNVNRFNWSELRFRSIAYPPVIDVDLLLERNWPREGKQTFTTSIEGIWAPPQPPDSPENPINPALIDPYKTKDKLHESVRFRAKQVDEDFPASWLALLTACKLDHPKWFASKPQSPDYLPEEFTATPAYATVFDLMTLVAMKSSSFNMSIRLTTSSETGLPNMQSCMREYAKRDHTEIDLDFRYHPIVGLYAVLTVSQRMIRAREEVVQGHDHPWGEGVSSFKAATALYARGSVPRMPPLRNNGLGDLTNHISDIRAENRTADDIKLLTEASLSAGCCDGGLDSVYWQHWHRLDLDGEFHSHTLRHNDAGYRLMTAHLKSSIRMFPWRWAEMHEGVKFLAMFSRFWSLQGEGGAAHQDPKPFGDFTLYSLLEMSNIVEFIQDIGPESKPLDIMDAGNISTQIGYIDEWIDANVKPGTLACRILSLSMASALCGQIVRSGKYPFQVREPELNAETINLGVEEKSFTKFGSGDGISNVIRKILRSTEWKGANPEKTKIASATYQEFSRVQKLWEWDDDKKDFRYPADKVQHSLDNILILRAILNARLLSGTTDNSDIMDNPAYNKLIPVL